MRSGIMVRLLWLYVSISRYAGQRDAKITTAIAEKSVDIVSEFTLAVAVVRHAETRMETKEKQAN